MPSKGSEAKNQVAIRMQEAFGDDFIGVFDKKIYVWATEGGARVQVCLTPTCPKTFIDVTSKISKEITPEERTTVEELMKRLNI